VREIYFTDETAESGGAMHCVRGRPLRYAGGQNLSLPADLNGPKDVPKRLGTMDFG
jgi:hypothetical protein